MKFALITEGASEHRIIKHIISKYFKDIEPDINQIQPKIVNQKQVTDGGWNEVLKYCERAELKDILVENDYLVIQIDTDQSETSPFNISHTKKGQMITDEELYKDIVAKLKGLIKPEIAEKYGDRILFAICIHTIECWLLFYTDIKKHKMHNCLDALNRKLRANDLIVITSENKNKHNGRQSYSAILEALNKRANITAKAKHNVGFKNFVDSLNAIAVE
jgi:hypothetical protein